MRNRYQLVTFSFVFAVGSLALAADVSSFQTMESYKLSLEGFGPVKFGMTKAQAEAALGVTLKEEFLDDPAKEQECFYLNPTNGYPAYFMANKGVIKRVDLYDAVNGEPNPKNLTDLGVGLDSKIADVIMNYDFLTVSPHPYTDPIGKYITHTKDDGVTKIIFETAYETDDITAMRGGLAPEVNYIEGCL